VTPLRHYALVANERHPLAVRQLRPGDLRGAEAVLGACLGDVEAAERIAFIKSYVVGQKQGAEFFGVVMEGEVIAVGGLQGTDIDPELSGDATAVEVIGVYVAPQHRRIGAASALLAHLEGRARARGFNRLIAVSGARNREPGYKFWRSRLGEPVRWDNDYFAPGAERVVWQHELQC
jgi:GNAT superfamily N-acetyltransferase